MATHQDLLQTPAGGVGGFVMTDTVEIQCIVASAFTYTTQMQEVMVPGIQRRIAPHRATMNNRDGFLPDLLQNCLTHCCPPVWQICCSCFSSAMSLATAKPFVNQAEIVLLYFLHISLSGFCKENISFRMNPKRCWFLQSVLVFIHTSKKNSRLCRYLVFSSSSAHNISVPGCLAETV